MKTHLCVGKERGLPIESPDREAWLLQGALTRTGRNHELSKYPKNHRCADVCFFNSITFYHLLIAFFGVCALPS